MDPGRAPPRDDLRARRFPALTGTKTPAWLDRTKAPFARSSGAMPMTSHCSHLKFVVTDTLNTSGCEECLAMGDPWVHLRLCRTCGHVGCCDAVEEPARDEALPFDAASDHHVARAGRGLEAGATSTRSRWSWAEPSQSRRALYVVCHANWPDPTFGGRAVVRHWRRSTAAQRARSHRFRKILTKQRAGGFEMPLVKINGRPVRIDASDDMPLLWALRDVLGMTGTKFGCGLGLCGACTVHIDGAATRSCITPLGCRRGKVDHHYRGRRQDARRSRGAKGLARRRSASVRLLSVGTDHVGIGASRQEPSSQRCGYRRGDVRQHLSLRHLYPDPRSHQAGRAIEGLAAETTPRSRS